jgi:hypothetical protein
MKGRTLQFMMAFGLLAPGIATAQPLEPVQTVLANVRTFAPDVKDAALDRRCASEEVERHDAELGPVSLPLAMRPPLRQTPR